MTTNKKIKGGELKELRCKVSYCKKLLFFYSGRISLISIKCERCSTINNIELGD